ncbi:MAG TPA: hypothetical protein VKH19_18200 [Gemmatimonadaceae bacterium]|nr:hypothetical protein [Gemmatimonadaceae bacterium]
MTFVFRHGAAGAFAAVLALSACKIAAKPQPSHRGIYTGGAQANYFIPCGENKMYWVAGKAKDALQSSYAEKARRQFQPIYVEVKAQVVPPGDQAPMEGTDGYLRIDTVLTATSQVPLECRPKGSDPRDF